MDPTLEQLWDSIDSLFEKCAWPVIANKRTRNVQRDKAPFKTRHRLIKTAEQAIEYTVDLIWESLSYTRAFLNDFYTSIIWINPTHAYST